MPQYQARFAATSSLVGQRGIPAVWGQFVWGAFRWQTVPAGAAKANAYLGGTLLLQPAVANVSAQFQAVTEANIVLSKYAAQFTAYTGASVTLTRMPQYAARFNATSRADAALTRMQSYRALFQATSEALADLTLPLDTRAFFQAFTDAHLLLIDAFSGHALFQHFFDSYIEIETEKFDQSTWVPQRDRSGRGGGGRPVSPALVWAICPRCGFRYHLSEMREEIYDQRPTGRRVCPECWDQDDPHLALYRMDLDDIGYVQDPLPYPDRKGSITYAASLNPTQWDHPIEARLGQFFVSMGGVDCTMPVPPTETGRKVLVGAMSAVRKEDLDGRRRHTEKPVRSTSGWDGRSWKSRN